MIYEIITNTSYASLTSSYSQYTHDKTLVQNNYYTESIPESIDGFNFLTDKGCLFIYIATKQDNTYVREANFNPVTNENDANNSNIKWHLYNLFSNEEKTDLKPMDTEISQTVDQENKHILLMSRDTSKSPWYTIPNFIGKIDGEYWYTIDCDWIKLNDTKKEPEIDGYYKFKSSDKINKIYYLGFNKPYCHDQRIVYNKTEDITPISGKSYYILNASDSYEEYTGNFIETGIYYEKVINYENIWNTKILNDNVSYSWFNENGELITNSSANSIVVEVW